MKVSDEPTGAVKRTISLPKGLLDQALELVLIEMAARVGRAGTNGVQRDELDRRGFGGR